MNRFFAPPHPSYPSRREFLRRAGNGAGLLALSSLLAQERLLNSAPAADLAVNPLAPRKGHGVQESTKGG